MMNFLQEADLFPGWARLHHDNPEVKDQLQRVRELRKKRHMFNISLPIHNLDRQFWNRYELYVRMRLAEKDQQDVPVAEAYNAHKACLKEFTPIVHRTFWARWLYLERALELASLSGDLLFGAIVLRTMAEDTWALLRLTSFEDELNAQTSSTNRQDLERIRQHGDLLLSRFLPPIELLRVNPTQIHIAPPKPFEGGGYEALESAFRALNDYVHPNYGSHLLALFPEKAKALSILLDAYITVYEHFYKIPWLTEVPDSLGEDVLPLTVRSWQEERLLLESTLREIQQHRAERGLAAPDEDPAPSLRTFLDSTSDTNAQPELAWQVVPDWFIPLRPLGEFLTSELKSDRELYDELISHRNLGLPMRWFEMSQFAGARRLANELEDLVSGGRPSPQDRQIEWFRFVQKALELMLTTPQYKMSLMTWSCIRQINDRNPIGAILAMRSVIEHYAVAVYLGNRLEKAWAEIEKRGSFGQLPVDWLVQLEEKVARFLAGTKGTEEEAVQWKEEWAKARLDAAINLRSATEKGLKGDVLGFLYNFGSDVIHGRRARGVEVCPPTDAVYCRANLSRALLALDLLNSMDYVVSVIRNAVRVLKKMESLATALIEGGRSEKEIIRIIRTALSASRGLIHGKHYFGQGTQEDPFTFAPGVEYYDAFYKLCEQLGLDAKRRRLVQAPDGRLLDQVPDKNDRMFYFKAPFAR